MKLPRNQRKLTLETLQARQLLAGDVIASLQNGQLYIEGTERADQVTISEDGGYFRVSGVNAQFASRNVTSIRVQALGGDDSVVAPGRLSQPNQIVISIDGGSGNDRIVGSPARDLLQGGPGNDLIYGLGGTDAIGGGGGDDVINGDDGNDDVYGDSGRDQLYGNQGDDRLFGGSDDDYLNLGLGHDRGDGGNGNDLVRGGDGNDQLQGNNGDDWIYGGSGDDAIGGGNGRDVINGEDGDDSVYGDSGANDLYGNSGADRVFGQLGLDFVRGGHGVDHINGGGDDFEVLGVDDSDFRASRGGGSSQTQANKVEGTITAIDLANNRITIQTRMGESVVLTVNTSTKIERNDVHVPLTSLVVGDRGEALFGNDLVASKLESSTGAGGGDDDDGGNNNDPTRRNRIEGSVTAIDLVRNLVTIETRGGLQVMLTITPQTKIERNDVHVSLSAIRIGDRGEARYGNDLVAAKLESVGA